MGSMGAKAEAAAAGSAPVAPSVVVVAAQPGGMRAAGPQVAMASAVAVSAPIGDGEGSGGGGGGSGGGGGVVVHAVEVGHSDEYYKNEGRL